MVSWICRLLASATLLVGAVAHADIVYDLHITIPGSPATGNIGGSVTGFIETDGAIGTLHAPDIVDWKLVLNDGFTSFTDLGPHSGSNSGLFLTGTALTATASGLFFNFGATDQSLFLLENPAPGSGINFLCLSDKNAFCASATPSLLQVRAAGPIQTLPENGVVQVAAAVPGPIVGAGLPGLIAACGAAFGFWRRKRTALAA
jgi:hypothetical protein